MWDKDLTIINKVIPVPVGVSEDIAGDMRISLANLGIWSDKLADKISELLDAKTLNNKWDEMNDNRAQQAALELVLKLNWVKWLWKWTQIAIFNNISKDEKLQY